MQKSISQETSPLGHPSQYNIDLLGEALAVSSASAGADAVEGASSTPRFTPKKLEDLFWALINVAGLKSPTFSATKIGEQYLNAYVTLPFPEYLKLGFHSHHSPSSSDVDGLVVFLNKMADRYPQHLSIILSHWFINKFVQLDAVRAGQVMEESECRLNAGCYFFKEFADCRFSFSFTKGQRGSFNNGPWSL